MRFFTLTLVLCGCGFSSVDATKHDDLAGVDFAGADLAGVDFGGADLATSSCNTCNCGEPALLVGIESVNGATSNDGKVLQLGLGTGGTPTMCRTLTAGKTLPKSPTALGWFPPDGVLYGGDSTLYLIDAAKDLYRWNFKTDRSDIPLSAFPLEKDGANVVGAGFDTTNFGEIQQLYILDPKNGMHLFNWDVTDQQNSPIVLGDGIVGMAQSPLDPTHLMYVKTIINDAPAVDVAIPYDGMMVKPMTYWPTRPSGAYLSTIATVRNAAGGLKRVAWLQHSSSSTMADAIYYLNDDGSGPTFTGPLTCTLQQCATPFKASDAVPDPTSQNRVITTCDSPTDNLKHVVRIDDSGTCTLIVDGSTLANLTYPSRLAIAEAR